jgi:hypothetical protein
MEEYPGARVRRPTKGQVVASLGLFLLGFVATAAILHTTVGRSLRLYADMRSEKLLVMDEWQGKAVSAAFGSSHVHDGFDPRAFDAQLQGTPLATRSINGGVAGGSQAEQRAMALEFLRELRLPKVGEGSPRACFVLLEMTAGANFTNDHLVHPRAINVYDWHTLRFISELTDPSMGLGRRLGRVAYAIAATALHYMNVGMVSNRIFRPPLDQGALKIETENDRRGLEMEDMTPMMVSQVAEEFAQQSKVSEPVQEAVLPGNIDLLRELDAASPVRNVQMLYVVMPMVSDLSRHPVYPATMQGSHGMIPILNLAQPDKYPELYQVKYWHDSAHLDEAGAGLASRLIGEQIAAWYASNPGSAQCGG